MTEKQISAATPMFVEVGKRFVNVASIAYVQKVRGLHGESIFVYLNVSQPDGKLHSFQLETEEEAQQIATFINTYLLR